MESLDIVLRPHILSAEEFSQNVIKFFRERMDINGHQAKVLVQESQYRFCPYLMSEDLAGIYIEVLFSLFEVLQSVGQDIVRDSLEDFMGRKLRHYFFHTDDEQELPLRYPRYPEVSYCVDPLTGTPYSAESFYSPVLVLDFQFTRRILRYGGRFQFNFLQMQCSLICMLKTLA